MGRDRLRERLRAAVPGERCLCMKYRNCYAFANGVQNAFDAATPTAWQLFFHEEDSYNSSSQPSSHLFGFKDHNALRSPLLSVNIDGNAVQNMNSDPMMDSQDTSSLSKKNIRRRAQNRASSVFCLGLRSLLTHSRQRAYRDRKLKQLVDLEAKINILEEKSTFLYEENEQLRRQIAELFHETAFLQSINSI